jgi:cell division transport system permease protein
MPHKWISLRRVFVAGAQSFIRNAWLSIAAMAVMVITLTIVLFSVIANATFSKTIADIRDRIDISVYLSDDITETQRNDLVGKVKAINNVKSVSYTSKEQALEQYKKQNQTNVDLQMAINQTDNPLPASLQIKLYDPDKIGSIKSFLDQDEIKALQSDETSYSGDRKVAIDKITKATTFIREAGLVGVIVFAIISMLIIFNTIQMAIFNRREELGIMRLLGATKWYIRGPFIVESILYGIVSAVISVALCNSLFAVSSSTLDANSLGLLDIGYANKYFASHFWLILGVQVALGIFIGVLSSLIATQRYLRFKAPT